MDVLTTTLHALRDAFLMAWSVWWALVLGFAISAIVQAWVPRERIQSALGGSGGRPVMIATGLGAASSSCSYAAVAIAKSLFQKGSSAASALAFQFSSTNLVIELGAVIWVLMGWQFTLAEFVGGLIMIAIMTVLLRAFISRRLEAQAREHAIAADSRPPAPQRRRGRWALRARLTSTASLVRRGPQLPQRLVDALEGDHDRVPAAPASSASCRNSFFNALFITEAPAPLRLIENVIVGPLIAIMSFVCSVGNVPLAAVLWSGGIGFAGVIAFIFADLLVAADHRDLPQVLRPRLRD